MKKIILASLLFISFIACEKEHPGETYWFSKKLEVRASEWRLAGEPGAPYSYYYADFDVPELDQSLFNEGGVLMYFEDPKNTQKKNAMPFIFHEVEGNHLWTTTYDFEFSPGSVRVICTYSDYATNWQSPGLARFHLVLIF